MNKKWFIGLAATALTVGVGAAILVSNRAPVETKADPLSVTVNMENEATAKSWANGTAYTQWTDLSGVFTFHAIGGGNNGKYYTSDKTWRMYNGGSLSITCADTYQISSVTSNPSVTFTIASPTEATVSFTDTTKFKSVTIEYLVASTSPLKSLVLSCPSVLKEGGTTTLSYTGTREDGNPWAGEVTYESSDPTVASIDGSTITALKAGTTNVTVKSGEIVSDPIKLTVEEVIARDYALVTDAASLTPGSMLIIGGSASGEGKAFLSNNQKANNRGAASASIVDGVVSLQDSTIEEIVLGGDAENGFTFWATKTAGYLYAAGTKDNYLKTTNNLSDAARFSITLGSGGVATIRAKDETKRGEIHYNGDADLFSCYSNGAATGTLPYLFRYDPSTKYKALNFANDLLAVTDEVCATPGYNNKTAIKNVWSGLANSKFAILSAADKVILQEAEANYDNDSEDPIENAMGRYNYLVKKYEINNFIDRDVSGAPVTLTSVSVFGGLDNSSTRNAIVIGAITLVGAGVAAGLAIAAKRRKEEK